MIEQINFKNNMPKKDEPIVKSLEKSPLEGQFVAVGYESVTGDEEINTILIYKIVNGKAINVFGVFEFPDYDGGYLDDSTLSEYVLKVIKEREIKTLYFLHNTTDKNWKKLPKEKTFGIEFGYSTVSTKIVGEDDEEFNGEAGTEYDSEWCEVSNFPPVSMDHFLSDLEINGKIKLKYFDVQTQKNVE
jgi:hypothetical protein